jgi:hypothetical protein
LVYSELHLDGGNEDGEQFARGIEVGRRDALGGRVAEASWKKTKNSDNAELRWKWSFRIGGFG